MSVRLALLSAATLALAAPAYAQQHSLPPLPDAPNPQGNVYSGPAPDQQPMSQERQYPPGWEQSKANWLAECRSRQGNDNRVGGALLGGVLGGVVGNRVAGKGNRVVGTVAGAAVGAVAGGAIGDAADKRAARDYCEDYLERNITWSQGHGYANGQQVVGYGYAPMTTMVPVAYVQTAVAAPQQQDCIEEQVIEEWVPVASPPRQRYIAPRPKPRPDKRVRIVPDKRVRTY
jgi:Glycine zipper 2TM domain